ncbi:LacI family DNA-binding transcriptional regulator [Egicoccus sp. AB-alg2]|uniref:LacI family DNA-binding transcriptional regulator n=1 Tax=Egicoccus sp. AB-alg2 TaxID=3242693 RepID=UPI00359CE980
MVRASAGTPPERRPSMADVAAVAGVSHQTVSRVLNSPEAVRPETRRRVESAIRQLGYVRNTAARALVTRRTRLIGVVSPGEALFGPASTTMAIEQAARLAGYATTLAMMPDVDTGSIQGVLESFRELDVEGIVVVAPVTQIALAAKELATTLPVVMVAAGLRENSSLYVVAVDQEVGARTATRHLIDLGHRDILHVAGPNDWFDARSRIVGWRDELLEAGLEAPPIITGSWAPEDGYEIGRRLVAERRLPSAIFAANDLLALGLVRAFHEAGVHVPGDVSVVGFDDIDGAGYWEPPMTTVRQPFAAVGQRAIEVLLAALEGAPSSRTLIAPELVVRGSCGPPR